MYHDDTYVSLSISVPKSLRREIHERALSLRITRTDYVKALIIADLSQGPEAPFSLTYNPRPRTEASKVVNETHEEASAAPKRRRRGSRKAAQQVR
jgi:hypothetical protein